MPLPLRYVPNGTGVDFVEFTESQLARLSYDLRLRYAQLLDGGGTGAIVVGGGTNFGSASDTDRTQQSATGRGGGNPGFQNPGDFPSVSTGVETNTFQYGINLNGRPTISNTDLANGYVHFDPDNNTFRQATADNILSGVLNDIQNEMRFGDELGTYRVSVGSPGAGWVDKGLFFRDTIFRNATQTQYNLWLKTSIPAADIPSDLGLEMPLFLTDDGDFQQRVLNATSPFSNLIFNVMRANPLRYAIDSGSNRGTFVDTRRTGTDTSRVRNAAADTYTTTVTPSGGAATHQSYFLGIL